jgi:hypothetical protein
MGLPAIGRLLRSLATTIPLWPHETAFTSVVSKEDPTFKVLLVVARPDHESECAAMLYRITHELGGAADQVVVTNGVAGTQYSAPAQVYYGLSLSEETLGPKRLAGFTFAPLEGFHVWNRAAGAARWRNFLQRVEERPFSCAVQEAGLEKAFSA